KMVGLLLPKRAENILRMVPDAWLDNWPANIWPSVTVESPGSYRQLDHLIEVTAKTKCVSVEPLLDELDLAPWLKQRNADGSPAISCLMVGGEFGNNSKRIRPMHPDWVRRIRDDCAKYGVLFHFKQHGRWLHESQFRYLGISPLQVKNRKYKQWPDGSRSYWCSNGDMDQLFDGAWHQFMPNPRGVQRLEGGVRAVPAGAPTRIEVNNVGR